MLPLKLIVQQRLNEGLARADAAHAVLVQARQDVPRVVGEEAPPVQGVSQHLSDGMHLQEASIEKGTIARVSGGSQSLSPPYARSPVSHPHSSLIPLDAPTSTCPASAKANSAARF
eukprot:scaffold17406_cov116-Isochrysis_galbana.AAC.8